PPCWARSVTRATNLTTRTTSSDRSVADKTHKCLAACLSPADCSGTDMRPGFARPRSLGTRFRTDHASSRRKGRIDLRCETVRELSPGRLGAVSTPIVLRSHRRSRQASRRWRQASARRIVNGRALASCTGGPAQTGSLHWMVKHVATWSRNRGRSGLYRWVVSRPPYQGRASSTVVV